MRREILRAKTDGVIGVLPILAGLSYWTKHLCKSELYAIGTLLYYLGHFAPNLKQFNDGYILRTITDNMLPYRLKV